MWVHTFQKLGSKCKVLGVIGPVKGPLYYTELLSALESNTSLMGKINHNAFDGKNLTTTGKEESIAE